MSIHLLVRLATTGAEYSRRQKRMGRGGAERWGSEQAGSLKLTCKENHKGCSQALSELCNGPVLWRVSVDPLHMPLTRSTLSPPFPPTTHPPGLHLFRWLVQKTKKESSSIDNIIFHGTHSFSNLQVNYYLEFHADLTVCT